MRFDWDGVNVAELYFESLEGASNPARFTPMNDDVRADFEATLADSIPSCCLIHRLRIRTRIRMRLRKFLDYRAELASKMQADWLDVIDRRRGLKSRISILY